MRVVYEPLMSSIDPLVPLRERIDAAIAKLSPEHRAAIVMREIDGLEYSEIAEHMECSIGTVMSRLFYARKKLQALLKDVYETI